MIIELMLMLIVVGAGIVFVAWSNTRRRRQDALDRREVEGSTGKLKQELERTATEIIGRMENHVTHLESILEESERNRTQLEGRVVELKKILKKAEGQSGEIRDLLAKLEDAGAEVDSMQRKMETLERRLNVVMSTPLQMQQPIQQPVAMPQMINPLMTQPITPPITPPPITPPPITTAPITPPQITKPMTPPPVTQITTAPPGKPLNPLGPITMPIMRKTEVDNEFDKILEESISAPKVDERPQSRESIILSPENKQPVKVLEADPVKIEATRRRLNEASAEMAANPPEEIPDLQGLKNKRVKQNKRDVRQAAIEAIKAVEKQSELESKPEPKKVSPPNRKIQRRESRPETTDSAIVKEMLLAGMSIEDISRETGLGRSAIEFIQEMIRRQLNRK